MAIVQGTNQLYYECRSWCAYYGALRGAFVGWALATPGYGEMLNNLGALAD